MVTIKTRLANRENYGNKRSTSEVAWIVIHYTANDGDHDESNGNYFANNNVGTSAHYFVDSDSITQSVPDDYVAYSVGGNYGGGTYYKKCTNQNSISIELCDDVKNGVIYPTEATINNALDLVRLLMKRYGISQKYVIRHYDVNGKKCPAYWVDDNKWKSEFWNKIVAQEIKNGLSDTVASDGNWYYYKNNEVDTSFNGLAKNKNGWFYVKNGKVDFSYNGFCANEFGVWYVEKGKVTFTKTDVIKNGTEWWNVVKSKVTPGITVAKNSNGWWYIDKEGKVDFTYNGLAQNENGIWVIEKGKVNFDYVGEYVGSLTGQITKGKLNQ